MCVCVCVCVYIYVYVVSVNIHLRISSFPEYPWYDSIECLDLTDGLSSMEQRGWVIVYK